MIRRLRPLVALAAFAVGVARAGDSALSENTIGAAGKLPPPEATLPAAPEGWATPEARTTAAAAALNADPVMVDRCREALDLLYQRDYPGARKRLDALTADYPTSGIGPFGVALLHQALMFENYDYRFERQYEAAAAATRAQLDRGLAAPGNEAFERFLLAGIQGIDAIHAMRKGEYLTAVARAVEGMRQLEKVKALAPTFADTALGDGLYLYWRSVVSAQSKALPAFDDRRAEGLGLLAKAEREAVFVGPGATLAIVYARIEDHDPRGALDRALAAHRAYPRNVIVNQTLARIYTSLGRYDDALGALDAVLAVDDDNQRVHYQRGIVFGRQKRYPEAQAAFERYLGFAEVPKESRGLAYYRLGSLAARREDYAGAARWYQSAIDTSGNELARKALARLRKQGLAG